MGRGWQTDSHKCILEKKKREETIKILEQGDKHIFPKTCNRKTTILYKASSYEITVSLHCGVFSSIPSLCLVDSSSTPVPSHDNQKVSPDFTNISRSFEDHSTREIQKEVSCLLVVTLSYILMVLKHLMY